MSATHSRRAGASLFAHLATPSRRTAEQTRHRAVCLFQQQRAVSSSTNRGQQQAQKPAAAPASRPAPAQQASRTPAPQTAASQVAKPNNGNSLAPESSESLHSLTDGLVDPPPTLDESERQVDWTRSYHGLSSSPFTAEQSAILQAELHPDDIEIKPDGILYLPEIKYRRILNKAFGPGGWGLAPRGETIVTGKLVTREYGLVCGGRYVNTDSSDLHIPELTLSPASSPSPAASSNTSTPTASPPRPRAANPTLSCAAAKTWESLRNSGTLALFAAS